MKRNKQLDQLNFGDACAQIPREFAKEQNLLPFTIAAGNCTTLGRGALSSGLNAGVQMYLQMVNTIITRTEATQGAPDLTALLAISMSEDYNTFVAFLIWWLPAGFAIETDLYFQEQVTSLEDFVQLRTTMLAVFLSALVMYFLVVFEPLVYEMDTHVKRVRALLVMIPAEVAQSTASLRKALMSAM